MTQPASPAPSDVEQSLYEVRKKIYPRAVHGMLAKWRIALVLITQLIYYGLPWLQWQGRQAWLFDLAERKFYIFGLVFWPQDIVFLTLLLIISAYALFFFTALGGRLFCGFACPQTVYSEIFVWIEQWIEGSRAARIRLDSAPWDARKWRIKATKHTLWILIALWTGFTFIGYFTPIRHLMSDLLVWHIGPWQTFWLFFYSFATWGNAGFMREQVCKYMCPYARFQGVMVDQHTLVVTYDEARGEPRGKRARSSEHRGAGLGDCVDCSICVQVCPTGIDIRDGQQYECIGCGACADACDEVMDKLGYARGLVRFTSAVAQRTPGVSQWRLSLLRPRVWIYLTLLCALLAVLGVGIATPPILRFDVIRDRGVIARTLGDGRVENLYQLQLMNISEQPLTITLEATGLNGLETVMSESGTAQTLHLEPSSNRIVALSLRADKASAGRHSVTFVAQDAQSGAVLRHEKSTFIMPR